MNDYFPSRHGVSGSHRLVGGRRARLTPVVAAILIFAGAAFGSFHSILTGCAASNAREVTPSGPLLPEEEVSIRIFREASPSVVNISTFGLLRDSWRRHVYEVPQGAGSGVIWDSSGIVLTNFHVISGAGRGGRVVVTLDDNASYEAEIIGFAKHRDLAVLRINDPPKDLKAIAVGAGETLQVGQNVYAIGNPFGLDHSLSMGIVSALGRQLQHPMGGVLRDLIQSDAAINPGNSGGPLLDSSGRMIGLNTAITSPSGASAGVGLSIPVDEEFRRVVPRLIKDGKLKLVGMDLLIAPDTFNEDVRRVYGIQGVAVIDVFDGGSAARAGLRGVELRERGRKLSSVDVITAINGKPTPTRAELLSILETYSPGDDVKVTYVRNSKEMEATVKLQELE